MSKAKDSIRLSVWPSKPQQENEFDYFFQEDGSEDEGPSHPGEAVTNQPQAIQQNVFAMPPPEIPTENTSLNPADKITYTPGQDLSNNREL